MATRSEQYRAEEQRDAAKRRRASARKEPAHDGTPAGSDNGGNGHVQKKATYALETTAEGQRPSRKSSRKSANRAKADATFNIVEELRKNSPASRFRKSRARAARVRGSKSPSSRGPSAP
jgi:hypothetical protein